MDSELADEYFHLGARSFSAGELAYVLRCIHAELIILHLAGPVKRRCHYISDQGEIYGELIDALYLSNKYVSPT